MITFDRVMQVLGLLSTLVTGVSIILKMRTYVTVDEYREGKAKLHNELNAEKIKVARLEVEMGYLRGGKQ